MTESKNKKDHNFSEQELLGRQLELMEGLSNFCDNMGKYVNDFSDHFSARIAMAREAGLYQEIADKLEGNKIELDDRILDLTDHLKNNDKIFAEDVIKQIKAKIKK